MQNNSLTVPVRSTVMLHVRSCQANIQTPPLQTTVSTYAMTRTAYYSTKMPQTLNCPKWQAQT